MRRRSGTRASLLALAVAVAAGVVLVQGCNVVERTPDHMKPPPGHGPFTGTVADWPLWFAWHNFGGYCFDTQVCEIRYSGGSHGSDRPQPSLASYGRPMDRIIEASSGPIKNFPPPAEVSWVTRDGVALQASVDIGEVFADRMVRHTAAREDISEGSNIPYPGIILVVDDRTISVYMRTWMALRKPTDPANPRSNQYSGIVLVRSMTY